MNTYADPSLAVDEREALILRHLPQVHLIARRIHERLPTHVMLEDLVSTGTLGLISAVDNYDPTQNVQLRTYAEHKIQGAILDSLRELDWAPRDARKRAKKIRNAILAGERRLQREPSEDEIAAELKISIEEYRKWLTQVQGIDLYELEYNYGDQDGVNLLRFVSDSGEQLPSVIFERAELERLMATGIEQMPEVERTVLSLYYEKELTLREIASVLDLHFSRVFQLKTQAILRLRSYVEKRWTLPVRPDARVPAVIGPTR